MISLHLYQVGEVAISAKRHSPSPSVTDGIQAGLDVVGMMPGFGEVADGINSLIYLVRGDYINAWLSAAAMIPIAGGASTRGKWGMKIANEGGSRIFEVGSYAKLRAVESGLEAHHVGQKALMYRFITNYDEKLAPSILVSKLGHTRGKGIVSRSTSGITNVFQHLIFWKSDECILQSQIALFKN